MWGTRKDLLFIGNFHRFFPFSPVFPGKVNHFAANLRHFPAGNVDSTAIFAVFPGKVNHFAANSRHFPAGNVDSTAIFAVFPGKVNHFTANLWHFPAGNVDFTAISVRFSGESEPNCQESEALSLHIVPFLSSFP